MLPHLVALSLLVATAQAQLTGHPDPLNGRASKSRICNVLDYGGSIGSNDIGPAILSAYNNCVATAANSTLYVPEGNYSMQTWVTLNHGSNWAFRLDGFINVTETTTGGHMIIIQNATDFEFYSANSKGGFRGNGDRCRNRGPHFLHIVTCTNWSVHDFIMFDPPEITVPVQGGCNGDVYEIFIRGVDNGKIAWQAVRDDPECNRARLTVESQTEQILLGTAHAKSTDKMSRPGMLPPSQRYIYTNEMLFLIY